MDFAFHKSLRLEQSLDFFRGVEPEQAGTGHGHRCHLIPVANVNRHTPPTFADTEDFGQFERRIRPEINYVDAENAIEHEIRVWQARSLAEASRAALRSSDADIRPKVQINLTTALRESMRVL